MTSTGAAKESRYRRRVGFALGLATLGLASARTAESSGAQQLASASPSPQPAASAASDPCGGRTRLLATLNRPTVGYSACAVPQGAVVLEEGYQSTFQSGPGASVTAAYPQGFERAGVAPRVELDLLGPSFNRTREGSGLRTGYSDFGLGFKYELPQRGRFTYGLDGLFTDATGTGGFSNGGLSQTANVDVSYSASPALGIGTTLGVSSTAGFDATGHAARYGVFLPSVVATVLMPHAYQFYAELVGVTKIAPAAGGRLYTDFGMQKLLGPYFEVDLEYGVDFTPVDGSRFDYVGFGTGVRLR